MTVFAISINIKHFSMHLNSAVFKAFIHENRKLPFLCLMYPLFIHLHKNPCDIANSSKKTIAWIRFSEYNYLVKSVSLTRKSQLISSQNFTFLGMACFSHSNVIRVPADRTQTLLERLSGFMFQSNTTALSFHSLL